MIPVVLELSGIPPERKAHDVTKGSAAACWRP